MKDGGLVALIPWHFFSKGFIQLDSHSILMAVFLTFDVFIDDARFKRLWLDSQRYYLVTFQPKLQEFEQLVGQDHLEIVAAGGGKLILTNHPLGHASLIEGMHHVSAVSKNPLAKPWVYR